MHISTWSGNRNKGPRRLPQLEQRYTSIYGDFAGCIYVILYSADVRADQPVSPPSAAPGQFRQAVEHSIECLQLESADWLKTRKCAACHHVPLPLWAPGEAERQGYAIDKEFLAKTVETLLGSKENLLASKIFPVPASPPDPRPQGRGLNMGFFLAVTAPSLPSLSESLSVSFC